MVETNMEQPDPPYPPRRLRLGGERRGEEVSGYRHEEGTSIHEQPPPDRPFRKPRRIGRPSGVTLHLRSGIRY